jgi:hypothetical protein
VKPVDPPEVNIESLYHSLSLIATESAYIPDILLTLHS